MKNSEIPLVSICCAAYNQAAYIRETLDGFIMQQTNFPFEIVIHDDASTDGTADIIREYAAKYPDLFRPEYETENQFKSGKVYNIPRAKGKYIAFCEGDDYWTDSTKLQRQVDFLESHPDYTIYCHASAIYCQERNKTIFRPALTDEDNGVSFDFSAFLKWNWFFDFASVMFCKDAISFDFLSQFYYKRDLHLFYNLLQNGKGFYLERKMCTYRRNSGGIYSGLTEEKKLKTDVLVYAEFCEKEKSKILQDLYCIMLKRLQIYYMRKKNPFGFFHFIHPLLKTFPTYAYPQIIIVAFCMMLKKIGVLKQYE